MFEGVYIYIGVCLISFFFKATTQDLPSGCWKRQGSPSTPISKESLPLRGRCVHIHIEEIHLNKIYQ